MKVCPKCSKTYDDENLNFCLEDGELLMETKTNDAPPTIMMGSPRQTNENWKDFNPNFTQQNQPNQQMYQPPFQNPATIPSSQDQTLPIVSIISGAASVVLTFCCYMGVLLGPIALVTGYLGMNNANKNPDVYGGKNLAIIGMVLGGVGFIFSILMLIFFFIASLV